MARTLLHNERKCLFGRKISSQNSSLRLLIDRVSTGVHTLNSEARLDRREALLISLSLNRMQHLDLQYRSLYSTAAQGEVSVAQVKGNRDLFICDSWR